MEKGVSSVGVENVLAMVHGGASRRIGFGNRIVAGVIIAIILSVAFGFYVSNTSQSKENAEAQEAIDRCREEADSYSGAALGKRVIQDVCRKLEVELHKPMSLAI